MKNDFSLIDQSCLHSIFVDLFCFPSSFVQLLALPPPEDAKEAIGKTVLPQDWSSGTDHA